VLINKIKMTKIADRKEAKTRTVSGVSAPGKLEVKNGTQPERSPVNSTNSLKEAFNFHMREHATLRKEIEIRNQELVKLQVYAVVGAAAVWSWLAASSKPLPRLVWYIPVIISILGLMKAQSHLNGISKIAEYLRKLENAVHRLPALEGWENFIHEERGNKWSSFSWNLFFWLTLIAATIAVPLLFSGV
jgi:hypothetical protein